MSDKELTREELLRETLRKTTCMTYDVIDSLLAQLSTGNDTDKEVALKHIAWHIPTGGPKMTAAGENGKLLAKQALLDEIKAIYMDGIEPEDPEEGEGDDNGEGEGKDEIPEEPTDQEVADDIKAGNPVVLKSNLDCSGIKYASNLSLNNVNNDSIDLNNFAITGATGGTQGSSVLVKGTSDIVIKNGTIEESAADQSNKAVVLVQGDAKLTLENVDIHTKQGIPVWMNSTNEIIIDGGNYSSDNSHVVYVSDNTNAGKVTILGGTFGKPGVESEWILNVQDGIRVGKDVREFIEVKGGTFYNFNPGETVTEGEGTNFVADGYEVEESGDEGNKVYTVVPAKTNSTMDVE